MGVATNEDVDKSEHGLSNVEREGSLPPSIGELKSPANLAEMRRALLAANASKSEEAV